jgi:protocatechuate 3,4-dioxygenase beta subunit
MGAAASRFQAIGLVSNAPPPTFWGAIPKGQQTFNGVPFLIKERIAVTGLTDARNGLFHPVRQEVALHRKADQIHLLLGAQSDEKVGVPIATVSLHYANGTERSLRLCQGVQVQSWTRERRERTEPLLDPNSVLAWSGPVEDTDRPGTSVQLYHTLFANPLPEEEIVNLELVSLFSRMTPFLCGLTLESGGDPMAPAFLHKARVMRRSLELAETNYHDQLIFRVRDAQNQSVISNAVAGLTLSDEESTFYFGRATADATGVIRLAFPPQQTLGYSAVVQAPGHVPVVVSSTVTNGGRLQRESEVQLERGARIGGVVQDTQGRPVRDATISIFQVTPIGPREYTRVDHETVSSDAEGRWSSESVPAGFTNFSFAVSHPTHRGRIHRQTGGGGNDPREAVDAAALGAGKAVLVVLEPLLVTGTVLDAAGESCPKAKVRLLDANRSEIASTLTDAQGRFSLPAEQEGEVWLAASASGHAVRTQSLQLDSETAPVQLRLVKAQPLRGRVMDQTQQPVVGAKVRFEDRNGTGGLPWQTFTDAAGRFVWETPPEGDIMFYISATNYNSTRMSFGGYGTGEHIIQLRKQSRVIGHVVDARTGKPIEEFQVVRGRSYNPDEPMRWERYDSVRGRKGAFSIRLEEYSSVRSQVLVESPGYMPQASPVYSKPGVYSNDFRLETGRGLSGVVQRPDGTPVPGVTVALVDSGETVGMERPGELRRNGNGPAFQRSSPTGHFEFPPKYDPHTVLAATEDGFAQAPASNVMATGKLVLQPWARIRGVLRVPAGPGPERLVRLQSAGRYAEEGRVYPALDLAIPVPPDASGNFVFEKVPPGERKVYLHYRIGERDSGRIALSHGVPVTVKPGATVDVVLGGKGRRVIGRVVPVGADPQDLDWQRDVQQMTSIITMPPALQQPPSITPNMTEEQQQDAWREYNLRQMAFWRTAEGRKSEREQRSYALLFDTNGTFRVENVEPGDYSIYFHITNPERGQNYYETIGSQSVNVTIPPGQPDEVFDCGAHTVPIRGMMRLGRPAPRFEIKSFDGKTVKLEDFQGKFLLLDFWASWAGTRSLDVRMLKEVNDTYGRDPRFALLGLNFDPQRKDAERVIEQTGLKWLQCYLGNWGSTELPGSFGVQGLPEALLIDPEGKIVARSLRGSSIRNTVRNQLGPAQTKPGG